MHLALQNKDAFVAGVECVRGRGGGDEIGVVTADQLVQSTTGLVRSWAFTLE